MTLKKMLLLASMAFAAVAFMAPAMAQADEWYTDHPTEETIPLGIEKEVEFTGELNSTSGGLRSGPCEVHVVVDVWNEEFAGGKVTGTGEVTLYEITTEPHCETNLPGCGIEKTTSNTEVPWHFNVGPGTAIDIEGANVRYVYTEACQAFGLPKEVEAKGTLTGQAVNGEGEVCIVFNNSGHMTNPLGNPWTLDGELCAANLTLK